MTKAEERALEAYPYFPTEVNLFGHKTITADGNSCDRAKFIKGYEAAIRDVREWILAQTSSDVLVMSVGDFIDDFDKEFGVK